MKNKILILLISMVVIFLGGCSEKKGLQAILTADQGKWELVNPISDETVTITFESKDEAIVDLGGNVTNVKYTISKNEDYIAIKLDDENSSELSIKVLDFEKEKIKINVGGSKVELLKSDTDAK